MQRSFLAIILGTAVLALIIAVWLTSPEPEPLPPLGQVPQAYWAEAEGTIKLENLAVPGRVRFNYLVYPDQRVVISNLVVWMNDLDWVVSFLWWEAKREPLRCTTFRNDKAIEGVLENGELVIPAGATVKGWSYFKRDSDGECTGEARQIDAESADELRAVHDPEGNHFALSASLETNFQDNDVTVGLEMEGHYLNRPPVAELVVAGEGDILTTEDGCPGTKKGDPPIAVANTPEGLLVNLQSTSYDPDGKWPAEQEPPKRPRLDLSFEQWARSRPGRFSFLGTGQEIGPVLFETGREHQIVLWITDRKGAEGRTHCHFQVVAP